MGWHVLTAGPSAGKSSLIRELSARGYETRPEAARVVIDQGISEGKDVTDIKTVPTFHNKVETQDISIIDNTENDGHVFFDRSIIDNLAYRRLSGHMDTDIAYGQFDFDTIFFLERIEFTQDEARVDEDAEFAATVHEELRDVYTDLGYMPVDVPLMDVESRADYIERVVEKKETH